MIEEQLGPSRGSPHLSAPHSHAWLIPVCTRGAMVVAGLLVVAAAFMVSQGADVNALLTLGYPGIAVVMFFSSATVLLPAPGFVSVLAATGVGQLNVFAIAIFAALGSSAGELTGYLVGLGSQRLVHERGGRFVGRMERYMRRWGFLTIFLMASIPNPFFDAIGLLAGSLGYPARRLWVATLLGNAIKYTGIALLGGAALSWLHG